MFEIHDVAYKDILHVKHLTIKKGNVTSIVGQSGSGKTTLLRLLNRLISYDQGEILFHGQPLHRVDPIALRRQVVMLPQNPAIYNGNIRDNLLIGLKFSEKPMVADDSLYKILKLVKLKKELKENTDKLSGGEKQRVALGRILLMEPEALLLDEPSSALDESTEQLIIEVLVQYTKSNGKTMVMVTHSKKIAGQFSDEIVEIIKDQPVNQREGV